MVKVRVEVVEGLEGFAWTWAAVTAAAATAAVVSKHLFNFYRAVPFSTHVLFFSFFTMFPAKQITCHDNIMCDYDCYFLI